VSWPWLVALLFAAALVVAAEGPRLSRRYGADARRKRERARRKKQLRVVQPQDMRDAEREAERDAFIRSVASDLDALPTIEETDRKT
jgi:hypothetical protein